MNSDQHHQYGHGRDLCGRGIVFWVGVWLLAIAAMQHPAVAEDRLQRRESVDRTTDESVSVADGLVQILKTLPATVEQTVEILKLLSQPETQQNLRQVEQVLRLLPSGMMTPATAP